MRTASKNTFLLLSGNVSASNTLNSRPLSLEHLYGFSLTAKLSGTLNGSPTGSLRLQGTNDTGFLSSSGEFTGLSDWVVISGSTVTVTGSAGDVSKWLFNGDGVHYAFIRTQFICSAGTGSMTVKAFGKGW